MVPLSRFQKSTCTKTKSENITMKKSIGRNYIYNLTYQVFLIIVPILVTPYVARVIGENGTGQYSYTSSITSYFSLFAALGCNYYAQRVIASHQGNVKEQSKDVLEIFLARLIPVTVSLLLYILFICIGIYDSKYDLLMLIQTINIAAIAFDINFFFQGNEDFGKIVLRNVVIKLISIGSIFTLVKTASDLPMYVLIQSLAIILSNLSMWIYLPNMIEKIPLKELHPLKHIKPMLFLFLPTIATSIYTSLDKTLIGIITKSDAENGNYEYAEKLVKMSMTILTSMGTVMVPRNSKCFSDGDIDSVKQNIYKTTKFVFFLGVPLMFGISVIADHLVPWYLGTDGYNKVAILIKLLSPIILIIGLSNVFGVQYLLPSKQDKRFTSAIVIGAFSNFILNLILIPSFQSVGAAIATVLAESIITGIMFYYIRKDIDFLRVIKESTHYWIAGFVLLFVSGYISHHTLATPVNTILTVLVGALVYFSILTILKDSMLLQFMLKARNILSNGRKNI